MFEVKADYTVKGGKTLFFIIFFVLTNALSKRIEGRGGESIECEEV